MKLNLPPLDTPPEEHRYPYVTYVAKVEERRQIAKALRGEGEHIAAEANKHMRYKGAEWRWEMDKADIYHAIADQLDPDTEVKP